ncbi:hypothetical protein M5X11_15970 [Paenibacillus alginolyticus]|uniref:hypothetical protein n=1 Tax=Paenibacillus alginolyticus TaxID=59839 RepID=UPI0003F9FC9F|nr:hypothetical protein [Paenibacillus alginolyticus]MCY9666441.1 hypothetical protein [Paenibacillus alginolyticus]
MNGIDFSKYSAAMTMIKENELEEEVGEYPMVFMGKDEAAVNLAEMMLLCRAAISDSIPLRQRSKVSANYYFSQVRSKSHILAQVEALAEYGMSFEDLDNLMSHQNRL